MLLGPAEAVFPTLYRPQLQQGWLWIDASKKDKPFQVEAAGLQIRDIGTRFGVRVPTDGPAEVHLIDGRVQTLAADSGKLLCDLDEAGKAFAFTTRGKLVERPLAADPFPGLPEWLAQPANYRSTVLGQAPVGYWTCDDSSGQSISNKIRGSSIGFFEKGAQLSATGVRPKSGFHGFPETNSSFHLTGNPVSSVLAGLDGLHGVSRREGTMSFWIRRSPVIIQLEEVLWLAGISDQAGMVPTHAILHSRITVSGRVVFEIKNDNEDVFLSSSRNIADGYWHHVVASREPASVDLYIDGDLAERDNKPRRLGQANLRGRYVRFGKSSLDLPIGLCAFNPNNGDGQAVREYITDSVPADYVLFVERKAVGVIEAKKETLGQNITTAEDQTKDYSLAKLKWVQHTGIPLPFLYEATGASPASPTNVTRNPAPAKSSRISQPPQ